MPERPAGLTRFVCLKCGELNYSTKWPWGWPLPCAFCGELSYGYGSNHEDKEPREPRKPKGKLRR